MKRGLIEALLIAAGTLGAIGCSEDPEGGSDTDATVVDSGAGGMGGMGGAGGMGGDGGDGGDGGAGGMGGMGGMGGEDAGLDPQCSDGIDNDGDGLIDFPDDRGCDDAEDNDETGPAPAPQCNDGIDNDADGRFDLEDTDCISSIDPTEDGADPVTVCANGLDDDGDGLTDFPADPGCRGAGDDAEVDAPVAPACANAVDDDADGLVDYPTDPGCQGRGDQDETTPAPLPACADSDDNDGDGAVDFPFDSGCSSAADRSEESACGAAYNPIDLNRALDAGALTFDGDLTGQPAGLQGSCGGNAGPEMIFTYRVDRALRRLTFTTQFPETTVPTVLYVRRTCGAAEDLACNRGVAANPGTSVSLDNPALGTYFVVVDTSSGAVGPGPFRIGVETLGAPHCRDAVDNDDDGLIDLFDPGCTVPDGESEIDPDTTPECADGLDNDGDGQIDYPADTDCAAAGTPREQPLCSIDFPHVTRLGQAGGQAVLEVEPDAGLVQARCGGVSYGEHVVQVTLDQRSDVFVDFAGDTAPALAVYRRTDCADVETEADCNGQPGLTQAFRNLPAGVHFLFFDQLGEAPVIPFEAAIRVNGLVRQCNDEVDNDADGLIDLVDPGCAEGMDDSEIDPAQVAQCADGIDNDGDGLIDYPQDTGCRAAGDPDERLSCTGTENVLEVGLDGGTFEYDTGDGRVGVYSATCGFNASSPEQVFLLDLPMAATVEAEIVAANYDTVLHMRTACDDAASQRTCNDDGGEGALSLLTYNRLEAGQYFFIADGYGAAAAGPATIDFRVTPIPLPICSNAADDDADGLIDAADPGCTDPFDGDETDPAEPAECGDGLDNDGDGLTDYPNDPGCFALGGASEQDHCAVPVPVATVGGEGGTVTFRNRDAADLVRGSCSAGEGLEQAIAIEVPQLSDVSVAVTNPAGAAVGAVVYLRRNCDDAASEVVCSTVGGRAAARELPAGTYYAFVERTAGAAAPAVDWTATVTITSRIVACNDEVDNDGDGFIDLSDPGCSQPFDRDETDPAEPPACADGIDNDGDGFTDYPEDPECRAAGGGFEMVTCMLAAGVIEVGIDGGSFDYDTTGRVSAYGSTCGGNASGPEQVFLLNLTEAATVQAEIVTAGYDTVLHMRRVCDDAASQVSCDDDSGVGLLSLLTYRRLEAGLYYFFADGLGAARAGPGTLQFRITPLPVPACRDGRDNDEDGLIDAEDLGCTDPYDTDETDAAEGEPLPVCGDGIDNDGDGLTDYPEDPGCFAAGGAYEAEYCSFPAPFFALGSEGGSFSFRPLDEASLATGSCANGEGLEQVVAITIDELSDVSITVTDEMGAAAPALIYLRSDCDDAASELACAATGGLLNRRLVGAGTLYAIIERSVGALPSAGRWNVDVVITSRVVACNDERDNDGDGIIDLFDPGCEGPFDTDETDPEEAPLCADGIDNDDDGFTDYPEDPQCTAAGGRDEQLACLLFDGVINVGMDGGTFDYDTTGLVNNYQSTCGNNAQSPEQVFRLELTVPSIVRAEIVTAAYDTVLFMRTLCDDAATQVECDDDDGEGSLSLLNFARLEAGTYFFFADGYRTFAGVDRVGPATINFTVTPIVPPQCGDGLDNDGDGFTDLFDPGCTSATDIDEADPAVAPECADGIDNDADGATDYPADMQCLAAGGVAEAPIVCAGVLAAGAVGDRGGVVVVNTVGRANSFQAATPGCSVSPTTSPDALIRVVLTAPATVNAQVTDDTFDTVLYLRSTCDNGATELACNDDGDITFGSEFTIQLAAGTYWLVVDGYGGFNSGTAEVTITVTP